MIYSDKIDTKPVMKTTIFVRVRGCACPPISFVCVSVQLDVSLLPALSQCFRHVPRGLLQYEYSPETHPKTRFL